MSTLVSGSLTYVRSRAVPRSRSIPVLGATAFILAVTALPATATGPGNPDPAFDGGYASAPFSGSSYFYGVATSGKKVVAAGYATASSKDMAAARFLKSGALDPTFSGDGMATVHFSDNGAEADDVLALPDGRTLLVGSATVHGDDMFALAMLRKNGNRDRSFGGDGRVTTSFPHFPSYAYTAVLLPNGKIVAGGELYRSSDQKGAFALARYMPDGQLDTSFGHHGRVVTNVEASDDGVWAMAVQDDGRIVASGWSSPTPSAYETAVTRYLPSGALDKTFSGNGIMTFDATPGTSNYSLGEAIRGNGKIDIGVHVDSQAADVLQLTASGKKDDSFGGGDGVAPTTDVFALAGLALQDDGKIVISGADGSDLAVFRMTANGSPDGGYGSGGLGTLGVASSGSRVVIDGPGRALVAGRVGSAAVARFLG
jgi:uncharacterized delta-60 repeat protein